MKRPRVLLADDHVLMAQALEHLLQAEFDVVGTVSDGRALLKAAGELLPDVVVVDIGMPLLNGLDAGEQLKALHPAIKVDFPHPEPRAAVRGRGVPPACLRLPAEGLGCIGADRRRFGTPCAARRTCRRPSRAGCGDELSGPTPLTPGQRIRRPCVN